MAQNVYEGMFIFDSGRVSRDASMATSTVEDLITSAGGQILASRLWDERRLAYPINGHRKGTYWLTYFRVDALKLPEMNRTCEINDSILRHLFLKIDPRIVDALVAHAQGQRTEPDESDVAKPAARSDDESDEESDDVVAAESVAVSGDAD